MGKGGSNSKSTTTANTTLTSTTTTIFDTKALAEALKGKTKADISLGEANLMIKSAEVKAKLNQNAYFVNELEGGLKKYVLLGGFAYVGYKIMKKKR